MTCSSSMPTWRAMAAAVRALSPVSMYTFRPRGFERRDGRGRMGLDRVGDRQHPGGPAVDGDGHGGFSFLLQPLQRLFEGPTSTASLLEELAGPRSTTVRPSTFARTPFPGIASNSSGSPTVTSRALAPATMASASGCSERLSAAAARARSSCRSKPSTCSTSVSCGSPRVMVPVLSSTTAVSAWAFSRCSPPLKRIAVLGAEPGAHHDGGGRGQPQGAGASDDQYRRHVEKRPGKVAGQADPEEKGEEGDADHRGDEVPRDDVGQALDRRLGPLRLLHDADDLGREPCRVPLWWRQR